jgi:ubiquinone/menaquinone biosynthesis C-methylase UbiE
VVGALYRNGIDTGSRRSSIEMEIISKNVDELIAPCLRDSPYACSGRELVHSARTLGHTPFASGLRAWCNPYLFNAMEQIFANGLEPYEAINKAFSRLSQFLNSAHSNSIDRIVPDECQPESENGHIEIDVRTVTGTHYGNLFKEFSPASYWDEPLALLKQRLAQNGISLPGLGSAHVLDAGCGGGRYTVAWRLLGAGTATGVDISPINIEDASRRVKESGVNGVTFREGDVLELPFENDYFDIVFSNGVLHHTTDWEKGVGELLRVLKPGGFGWLYLIEEPGGLFWDVIEILRVIMKDEDKLRASSALAVLGIPANRIFYMLDHVMVPINERLTKEAVFDALKRFGASDIRRLERGADFDRVEQIFQKREHAELYFGVGENRFAFSKYACIQQNCSDGNAN